MVSMVISQAEGHQQHAKCAAADAAVDAAAALPPVPCASSTPHSSNFFSRLASVEVQSVMAFLSTRDILRLSRCTHQVRRDANASHVWEAHPITLALAGPDCSVKVDALARNPILSHAWLDLRWVGADAHTEANLRAVMLLPARIRRLLVQYPASDEATSSAVPSTSASRFVTPWSDLLGSPAMSRVESVVLRGCIRGIALLCPRDGTAGPFARMRSLTSLDLAEAVLYGNSLRSLRSLTQLQHLRLTDADWALQSLSLEHSSRLPALSGCRSLTELDIRRPVLAGPMFAHGAWLKTVGPRLQKLTLRDFNPVGTLKTGPLAMAAADTSALKTAYVDLFAAFSALTYLRLVDVATPDVLLKGIVHLRALRELHIRSSWSLLPAAETIAGIQRHAMAEGSSSVLATVRVLVRGQRPSISSPPLLDSCVCAWPPLLLVDRPKLSFDFERGVEDMEEGLEERGGS